MSGAVFCAPNAWFKGVADSNASQSLSAKGSLKCQHASAWQKVTDTPCTVTAKPKAFSQPPAKDRQLRVYWHIYS